MAKTNVVPISPKADALRGIFRKPLPELTAADLANGVQLLEQRLADANRAMNESERDIRKRILAALGSETNESMSLRDELAKVRSSRDVIALALEAAREYLAAARTREREAEVAKRRKVLEGELEARAKIADDLERCLDEMARLFNEMVQMGNHTLGKLKIKPTSSSTAEFRHEQIQRTINIHLAMRGDCRWACDNVPATRMPLRFAHLTRNAHNQLLLDFEEKVDVYLRKGAEGDQASVQPPTPPEAA